MLIAQVGKESSERKMHETSKAQKRREKETDFPWPEIFKGRGLDVGSGDDPLLIAGCEPFDLPDGGGDDITQFVDGKFDYIHGSQVLEHAISPVTMIRTWLEVLNPKGYIVATIPDWALYEKRIWRSQWNNGHNWAWTLSQYELGDERAAGVPLVYVPQFLENFDAKVLVSRLIDTNYDYSLSPSVDQTLDPDKGVEAFIEFVLKKP